MKFLFLLFIAFSVSSCTPVITCFVGDCLVSTPDGPRAIASLKPGDLVLSFDLKENKWVSVKVLKKHRGISHNLYKIKTDVGEIVGVTPNHLFYAAEQKTFIPLQELSTNSLVGLKSEDRLQPQTVRAISKAQLGWRFVYDITVEGPNHNYLVNNILVHNKFIPFSQTISLLVGKSFISSNQFEANFLIVTEGYKNFNRVIAHYSFYFIASVSNQNQTVDFGYAPLKEESNSFKHMFYEASFGSNLFSNLSSVRLNSVELWNTTEEASRPLLNFELSGQIGVLWEK